MRSLFLFLALTLGLASLSGQRTLGRYGYTEYQGGSLPIIISVPHGGALNPVSIPDRTCPGSTTVTDANTIQLAQQIDTALFRLTGRHPHLIYCHLRRTKVDCNRNLDDGTCGHPIAAEAWQDFQDFIKMAQSAAQTQFGHKTFYIDLHGHGNPIQRVELGYLLSASALEQSDAVLNARSWVEQSSIRALVGSNVNAATHTSLLRGDFALGTLLENAGYPAVPSQQTPSPGLNNNYFNGGYNTATHSSYPPNNRTDGVQIECNFTGVRDTPRNRSLFAQALAQALLDFFKTHHLLPLQSIATSLDAPVVPTDLRIYPNCLAAGESINILGVGQVELSYTLFCMAGQAIAEGRSSGSAIRLPLELSPGAYVLILQYLGQTGSFKVFVL
jgi:N-formylglutamate amidohydrolase